LPPQSSDWFFSVPFWAHGKRPHIWWGNTDRRCGCSII
jgi:hypothetical protein